MPSVTLPSAAQVHPTPETPEASDSVCSLSALANATPGVVRCPVCFQVVPPEHIGYKLHCRHCGYLESCCNPV